MKQCMLATDADLLKLRFPVGIQPKIDGVRGYYPDTKLLARSNKEFRNKHTQAFFSNPIYQYLDGEFAAEHECHPELCRKTTSATSTHDSVPYLLWHVFDYVHPDWLERPYQERHAYLASHVTELYNTHPAGARLRVVPLIVVNNLEELLAWEDKWLNMGYEGIIIRDLDGKYKQGRSTVKQMQLLRIKRFIDFEFTIVRFNEGNENTNEATVNERGYTQRSSHQENLIPNGMVGSIIGCMLKDVCDPQTGKVLLTEGQEVKISPGEMDHAMRASMWEGASLYYGQIGKAKFFPKGHKDKPRFPIWLGLRAAEDM